MNEPRAGGIMDSREIADALEKIEREIEELRLEIVHRCRDETNIWEGGV